MRKFMPEDDTFLTVLSLFLLATVVFVIVGGLL